MPSIDRSDTTPYYQQVYAQIAYGIESGLYTEGSKLPSIRECARELGVSNTTIELAYQRLTSEGYVQPKRGSGYTVCAQAGKPPTPGILSSDDFIRDQDELTKRAVARQGKTPVEYDFAYDAVDATTFPYVLWARICREVFFAQGLEEACLYNDCQGLHALRSEIARYLGSEYGLTCTPEQVLVMPTTRDLIQEVLSLFDPAGTVVAMENPGYDEVRKRLLESGYRLKDIPMYPYPSSGEVKRLLDGVTVTFATPACQFPTNVAMPLDTRRALVEWTRESGSYIIDDEYGWEFQSGLARTPSLAALDGAERVITMGTFSNSFTPAVCLSYAVLPPQLMLKWQDARRGSHPRVPWQTQSSMALFIRAGHWRAHVRKVRTAAQRKRRLMADAIARTMGDAVDVIVGPSSLFVLVRTQDGRGEDELIEAAAQAGVRVYPTNRYWNGAAPDGWRYVQVGFAGVPEKDVEAGITALAAAWGFGKNQAS